MPPPLFRIHEVVVIKDFAVRKDVWDQQESFERDEEWERANASLPPGAYRIEDFHRDEDLSHDFSDGYSYCLTPLSKRHPLYGERVWVWQDHLIDAISWGLTKAYCLKSRRRLRDLSSHAG